ncbi:MAG: transglycosylase SLT domain-containing protein [Betaproteobacteria bacterium]
MFRRTPLALLCAALFASSAAALAAAPADTALVIDAEARADARVAAMPVLGINDEDFPIEPAAMADGDLWERIRKGFSIPDLSSALVSNHTQTYAAHPEAFERLGQRASRYLFYVVQELEKRGMPTELALLPVIESGFNPNAYSRAKAAGMWQFIPSTGLRYNLKQNAFRDERRDVVASTNAALNYLEQLHAMFGDWQVALAAYNWGEGSVRKAIARARAAGRGSDYNSLSPYMPAETRNYYPKLQAVKNIVALPSRYQMRLPVIEDQPYFTSVKKTRDIDIKLAAELAEMPLEEFKALNPQFNRPVITGSADTQILLPHFNAERFKENLANWTRTLSSWTSLRISAARERIETIAARFKTTPQVIRDANAIPANMQPTAGSTLIVPKTSIEAAEIGAEIADNAVLGLVPEGGARRSARSVNRETRSKPAARTRRSAR